MAEPHVSPPGQAGGSAAVLADTARQLASTESARDVLAAIVDTAVERVPGCAYAGVTVLSRSGGLDTRAATHDLVHRSDAAQAELREGPCWGAAHCDDQVAPWLRVDDMAADGRWPRYAPRAGQLGLTGVLGFPAGHEPQDRLAALTLYATTPHAFDHRSEQLGIELAAQVALCLAWARSEDQLRQAMHARQEVGEAVGVLMERGRLTADHAVETLRQKSVEGNVPLREVAERVIETGEEPPLGPGSRLPTGGSGTSPGDGPRTRGGLLDEPERLAAVQRYRVLDTPPEGAFDRICALAARFCRTPIATVTIVDEDRVWLKARHGVDAVEISHGPGLCASAIQADSPYVVTDAAADPRVLNNPLVRDELGLRFYAAAPIITYDGYRLGTVNVIDTKPREASADELATLQELAAVVADELELRLSSLRTVADEREWREQAQQDKTHLGEVVDTLRRSLLPPRLPSIQGVELAAHYHPASPDELGGDFYDIFPTAGNRWNLMLGDVCGKGPQAAARTSLIRHTLRTAAVLNEGPAAVLYDLNKVMLLDDEKPPKQGFCTVVCAELQPVEAGAVLTVADGGHPPGLVARADGSIEDIKSGGTLVGALPEPTFIALEVALHPGDTILFYTDGITEARTRDGSFFGTDGLAAALHAHAGQPTGDIIAGLRHVLTGFDPPPSDDVALLALGVPTPSRHN